MSAAAGIGALSISTIEGTYRGNEKQILSYTYIHFFTKKIISNKILIIRKSLIKKSI